MPPPDDTTQTELETQETEDATQTQEQTDEQPKEPSEGGDGEADAQEPADTEADGDQPPDAEAKGGEQEPEEKRKRAGGWQRKIERQERQIQLLTEQLSRGQGQPAPVVKPDKDKTAEEKTAEYIDNLVEQRLVARETQQRQKTVVKDFQRRTAEVRAAHDDFDDVVPSADIPIQSALGQALLTSEHGPAIMYQLAKSPAELARLSALPPLDAAREIGRLEAKLSSSTPPGKTNGTAKRPPAPPTSVKGSTSNTRSLEDLPMSDYKRAYRSGRR